MEDELNDHDFEGVSALIKQEEAEALAFFRAGNFWDRLRRRLQETAARKKRPAFSRPTPVPFLAAAAVLIMAGVAIFVLRRPGAAPPSDFKALAFSLGRLPGLSRPPEPDGDAPVGRTGTSQLEDSIRRALAAAEQLKKKEEQRIPIPAGAGRVPRLSPDQRMRILFRERAIERVLLLIKEDSKEV